MKLGPPQKRPGRPAVRQEEGPCLPPALGTEDALQRVAQELDSFRPGKVLSGSRRR